MKPMLATEEHFQDFSQDLEMKAAREEMAELSKIAKQIYYIYNTAINLINAAACYFQI